MSSPELPLLLAPRAEQDFADILQYTLETWGEAQLLAYRKVLDEALRLIQRNPSIGHGRPELSKAHRVLPAGRHVIIYRLTSAGVLVARILHERMDLGRHCRG